LRLVNEFFNNIKSIKFNLGAFFISLLSIIYIRTFFEDLFESKHLIAPMDNFYDNSVELLHVTFSWISVFLSALLIINLFDKDKIENSAKIVLSFFPIIIIVPFLDMFVFQSGEILYETNFDNFWFKYLNLFDYTHHFNGVTSGVRIEIFLIVILSFFYVYTATSKFRNALFASLLLYTMIFFYGYLPAFYNKIFLTHYDQIIEYGVTPGKSIIQFNFYSYIPVLLLLIILLFRKIEKKYTYMIYDSFRIERLSIYIGIFLFGFFLSAKRSFIEYEVFNIYDMLKLFSALLSISFAFAYATVLNNIYDIDIDKISNKTRALVLYDIDIKIYKQYQNILLFFAFCFAVAVNSEFVFIIGATIALSYVYSAKPLRIKRFVFISSLLLSFIAVFVFLAGINVINGNVAFLDFQKKYLFALFLFYFAAVHLKDIKDIQADTQFGILTLPIILKGKFLALKFMLILVFFLTLYILQLPFKLILPLMFVFSMGILLIKNSEIILIFIQALMLIVFIGVIIN
jgi:4-hydroxybenzoate polyprenyltransferase